MIHCDHWWGLNSWQTFTVKFWCLTFDSALCTLWRPTSFLPIKSWSIRPFSALSSHHFWKNKKQNTATPVLETKTHRNPEGKFHLFPPENHSAQFTQIHFITVKSNPTTKTIQYIILPYVSHLSSITSSLQFYISSYPFIIPPPFFPFFKGKIQKPYWDRTPRHPIFPSTLKPSIPSSDAYLKKAVSSWELFNHDRDLKQKPSLVETWQFERINNYEDRLWLFAALLTFLLPFSITMQRKTSDECSDEKIIEVLK